MESRVHDPQFRVSNNFLEGQSLRRWVPQERSRRHSRAQWRGGGGSVGTFNTPRRSVGPYNRSVRVSKPRPYAQTSYIEPSDVEPFSTFKRSRIAEPDGFPTALCPALGCWLEEPHVHDPSELPTPQKGENYSQNVNSHNSGATLDSCGESVDRFEMGRLVSALPRLGSVKPSPASDRQASMLEPHGSQDLRDALPSIPSYHSSELIRPKAQAWQMNLPIHTKPVMRRDHDGNLSAEAESAQRQRDISSPGRPISPSMDGKRSVDAAIKKEL